ncbi:MAG: hypothetical protein KKG33_00685 [candidate division Zixibacteria bacterium]|nr:hypothetical protein [candidate division Zixibacteria bacterium]MBU1472033.1 hypothetical protein [candidate division Zixibacteria bacterium]MBU2624056.1 hypothetical protein [candidate division Zixibacteria bacterium]
MNNRKQTRNSRRTVSRLLPGVLQSNALLILTVLISVLTVSNQGWAATFPRAVDIAQIRQIVEAGFRDDYAQADSIADGLKSIYPDHPIGFVMQAAMKQSEMLDMEHFDFEDEFYKLLQFSEEKSEAIIDSVPHDAWAWYCLGLALGSRAVYDARKGSWWSATRRGIKAKRAFTECTKSDSTFYDAYVGLGSYHYWRTVKTRAVNWLPFVQDDREEGLRELNLAINKSLFSADFARNALMWILIDREEYAEAESLAVQMQRKYPEGRKFLWGMAMARSKLGNYIGAEAVFAELIGRIESDSANNDFNVVECRFQLAEIHFDTENYQKCIDECDMVSRLTLSDDVRERLKGKLSDLKEIRRTAEKRLKEKVAVRNDS